MIANLNMKNFRGQSNPRLAGVRVDPTGILTEGGKDELPRALDPGSKVVQKRAMAEDPFRVDQRRVRGHRAASAGTEVSANDLPVMLDPPISASSPSRAACR